MELGPGVQVTDNLRLIRRLGEGGMGTVWEAEHLTLGATVALKILAAEAEEQSLSMVARFKREALAASRIPSPHVVKIFESGVLYDGTPHLVMEMLEGRDLAERIEEEGPLPVSDVVAILTQVGRALSKAHAAGVVHRDVKPDNVFLCDEDGEVFVKVLDFGIAKQLDVKTHSVVTMTGTMVGTPAYMSPEQVLSGKDVDHRADIWSFGVTAYHALTGDIPFIGETLGGMCVAIANGKFIAASRARPDLPAALDAWFDRALSVNADDRFASIREAMEAFQVAARGAPTGVPKTLAMKHGSEELGSEELGSEELGSEELGSEELGGEEQGKELDDSEKKTLVMRRKGTPLTTSVNVPMSGPSAKVVALVALVSAAIGAAIALPIMLSQKETAAVDRAVDGATPEPSTTGGDAPNVSVPPPPAPTHSGVAAATEAPTASARVVSPQPAMPPASSAPPATSAATEATPPPTPTAPLPVDRGF